MPSHTASGEWQSFEGRMRRRRAERLALRAEMAANAGNLDDARACLDEARALAPGLPVVTAAEQALESALLPPEVIESTPATVAPRPVVGRYIAVAAVGLLAVAGVLLGGRRTPAPAALPSRPLALAFDAPAAIASRQLTEIEPSFAAPVAEQPSPIADVVGPPSTEVAIPTALPPAPVATAGFKTTPDAALPDAVPALTVVPGEARATAAERAVPEPPVLSPAPTPAASPPPTPAAPLASASAASPPPIPAAPPAAESAAATAEVPMTPAQEPLVRGVLNRYASAYNALDANAAQRVWPSVNREALARAFEGLASQRVSLGDCQVNVDGASATARCAGLATWTPKIGSGTHSEARQWTFQLSRASTDWQIVSARVQNR